MTMDASETLAFIANRIRTLCDEAKINVNELAELSGLSTSTVHALLNCRSSNPRIASIDMICQAFSKKLCEFWNSDV